MSVERWIVIKDVQQRTYTVAWVLKGIGALEYPPPHQISFGGPDGWGENMHVGPADAQLAQKEAGPAMNGAAEVPTTAEVPRTSQPSGEGRGSEPPEREVRTSAEHDPTSRRKELQIMAMGEPEMLLRHCIDCGMKTGNYCDGCLAKDRFPDDDWAEGQMTPLCTRCDQKFGRCHRCRGEQWCVQRPRG
ncbi:hypothetical protein N9L68_06130 [bacterium]|nr:hypothetical protein [bacterium]